MYIDVPIGTQEYPSRYANSRTVRLTRLGEQLRDDLRELHRGLTQTMERARLAARGKTGTLRVSLFPANIQELRRYWETFRTRHPQWDLRLRVSAYRDPFAQLRNGDVDILVTWLPIEEPDLTGGPRSPWRRSATSSTSPSILCPTTGSTGTCRSSRPRAG